VDEAKAKKPAKLVNEVEEDSFVANEQ